MARVLELAKMIDHSLLHPTMTDEVLRRECGIALKYNVASVCIKPYAVPLAAQLLQGSDVMVGTVIGFPHGNSKISIKVQETVEACREGAVEIDMVVNVGKVLQQDWDYVTEEIRSINEATLKNGAILKVIFGNDYLPEDSLKIRLCQICTELGVAFVKTSTGYDYMKSVAGQIVTMGATEHDLKLMREHSGAQVQVKAAGGVRTLDDLLQVKSWGVTRIGATATAAILEEARRRYEGATDALYDTPSSSLSGY